MIAETQQLGSCAGVGRQIESSAPGRPGVGRQCYRRLTCVRYRQRIVELWCFRRQITIVKDYYCDHRYRIGQAVSDRPGRFDKQLADPRTAVVNRDDTAGPNIGSPVPYNITRGEIDICDAGRSAVIDSE